MSDIERFKRRYLDRLYDLSAVFVGAIMQRVNPWYYLQRTLRVLRGDGDGD